MISKSRNKKILSFKFIAYNFIFYFKKTLNIKIIHIRVLSLLSYTFGNGPWKFAYVKFGYSPKENFESINFQVLDIAVQEKDIPLNH